MLPMTASTFHLRPAGAADHSALARLAALDDAEQLHGDVMMAFSDGHVVAAMARADGRVVADPFTRTADVVEMLGVRARQARRSGAARRFGLGRLGLVA